MASVVDIANMALMECGQTSITALADANERARACNTAWPFVRRTVLAMHPWNAPTKRVLVDEDATDPTWGFSKRYLVPTDCLRVLEVDTDLDWRIENGFIVTDAAGDDLGIRYIYDEEEPEFFAPGLTDALVAFLALRIMYRVNADKAFRDRIEGHWARILADAKRMDAQEQSDAEIEDDTWLTCRG